jgi:hypothetical protein
MINHTLLDLVDGYMLRRDIPDATASQYRWAIHTIGRHAGEPLSTRTISDDQVNRALLSLQRAGRSPHYLRSVKAAVVAVWRDAADSGYCQPPGRIRTIRTTPPCGVVWTHDQVQQLVAAARMLQGEFRHLPLARAWYWETLIRAAWDSGLRRRDLHRFRRCDLSDDFIWRQQKTKRPVRVRLRASTLARIDAWGRGRLAVLWPLFGTGTAWDAAWRQLVGLAKIPYGPFKTIRKSAGTAAEAQQPGAGHLLLGNTRGVFERHYLDASQVKPPQPPEIK